MDELKRQYETQYKQLQVGYCDRGVKFGEINYRYANIRLNTSIYR